MINEMKRFWVSSVGVQSWLLTAGRTFVAEHIRHLADRVDLNATGKSPHPSLPGPESCHGGPGDPGKQSTLTPDSLAALIASLRKHLAKLDDVEHYSVIAEADDDMYELWKELERKMQRHRRSEASYQLKDMFRI